MKFITILINKWKQKRYEKSRIEWRKIHPIITKETLIATGALNETFLSPEDMLKSGPKLIIKSD